MCGARSFLKKCVLYLLALSLAPHAFAQESTPKEKPLAVILSFSPQPNRKINTSDVLAQKIKALAQPSDAVDFHFCTLSPLNTKDSQLSESDPGPGPAQAKDCIRQLEPRKPTWIIAMGETNLGDDWVHFETVGYNWWRGLGENEKTRPLLPGGVELLGSTLRYHELFCSAEKSLRRHLRVSSQPGVFACNQVLYELLFEYKDIQVGFLHIHTSLYEKRLGQISSWIKDSVIAMYRDSLVDKEPGTLEMVMRLGGYPLTYAHLERWKEIFEDREDLSSCEKTFANQFRSLRYD